MKKIILLIVIQKGIIPQYFRKGHEINKSLYRALFLLLFFISRKHSVRILQDIFYIQGLKKKNTQNSRFSQYSISRIYFIFRDLKKIKFHRILVYVFPWDPSFRYLSRTGSQLQTLVPPISLGFDPVFIFSWGFPWKHCSLVVLYKISIYLYMYFEIISDISMETLFLGRAW